MSFSESAPLLSRTGGPRNIRFGSPATRLALGKRNGIVRFAGEMAEWLKAHAWNACGRETVSRVRIPLSPYPPPPIGACSWLLPTRNPLASRIPRQSALPGYCSPVSRDLTAAEVAALSKPGRRRVSEASRQSFRAKRLVNGQQASRLGVDTMRQGRRTSRRSDLLKGPAAASQTYESQARWNGEPTMSGGKDQRALDLGLVRMMKSVDASVSPLMP